MNLLFIIAVVLTILKLFNLISWSWAAVCAPLWIPFALMIFVRGIDWFREWTDNNTYYFDDWNRWR